VRSGAFLGDAVSKTGGGAAGQIILSKELDGITVEIPAVSRNFYVDGHVPVPH